MARSGANLPEGCSSAGRGCPKRRSHASEPKPMTQESPPSRSRNSTARTSAARSPQKRAQSGAIFRARIERCDQEDRGASERRGYCLCEGRRSACYFGCVRRIGLHRASTLGRSGCLGIAVGFLQVPAKLIAHRGQEFISEVDLAATRSFSSCDDAPNVSADPKRASFRS
jgi:hypothetical protein